MLKLKMSYHKLSVEIDRYKNRKIYYEMMRGTLCGAKKIQYLYHVANEYLEFDNFSRKT